VCNRVVKRHTLNGLSFLSIYVHYFSSFISHFPEQPRKVSIIFVSILEYIGAKNDGGGGNNWTTWAIRSCKAPVKSSPPTNQHTTFHKPDALPVAQSTLLEHWREKGSHSTDLLIPNSASNLVFDHQMVMITLRRVVHPLTSVPQVL